MTEKRGERGKKGQVWVETVIYTLIGLTIMGAIIAVVTPKITQMNDKILLTQTIDSMNQMNEQIQDTFLYPGSQREITLMVKKGEYSIDGTNDKIEFLLKNTGLLYSQPNIPIKQGDLEILTVEKPGGKKYDILLTLNYRDSNLTYQDKDQNKTLTAAPLAYRLLVINNGASGSSPKKQIDIKLISG